MHPDPISAAIAEVAQALDAGRRAVLVAPPGTGKTTRVPLALLDAAGGDGWLGTQCILMLEPRRIAARSAAEYMSRLAGRPVGDLVGYRTRGDSRVSAATRVEIVTERLLTRRLQHDPGLEGVGLVIFDEVHERSLDTDLGLALCLDAAMGLRPDLRMLAMSATPDVDAITGVLGDDEPAPAVVSEGVAHPVVTTYLGIDRRRRLDDEVADAVAQALRESTDGDVLVFLPGRREIRWTGERLAGRGIGSVPLTAGLASDALDAALRPDPGGARKVILATSVAQTSLTIDGVLVVVDAGLERSARFDPARGLSGLVTVPVSRAAADQRRGRAGRQAPGRSYRLWTEAEHSARRAQSEPEIDIADLCGLVLDVAAWGVADPTALQWISTPPPSSWQRATKTLRSLGAIDDAGRITADGRRIAELGAHPRLGRLMLDASTDDAELGTVVAAVIEAGARGDLRRAVEQPDREAERVAGRWLKRLGQRAPGGHGRGDTDDLVGEFVAAAFPEWVARRRDGERHRYLTAGGIGAVLDQSSSLAGSEWLAIAELERVDRGDQRVVSGAPLGTASVERLIATRAEHRAHLTAERYGTLTARSTRNVGAIVVGELHGSIPDLLEVVDAAAALLAERGMDLLGWDDAARSLQTRTVFARTVDHGMADVSDDALIAAAPEWLGAHLTAGAKVRLATIRARDVIDGRLGHRDRQRLDELAPTHYTAPSGRRHSIDYGPDGPFVRLKLQEMFGAPASPRIGNGLVPLTLHLLSPAGRPLQVTQDLASFWSGAYPQVRGEMRGRYPKHPWPDDPTAALPTASAKGPRRS